MGVWHDSSQPQFEETGAVRNVAKERRNETGSLPAVGIDYSLDAGRLMGVPYYLIDAPNIQMRQIDFEKS